MSTLLKQLKSIKQDTKLTVFGYVRQNENNLSLFCNVPSMISYLCLSYYFHGEYFEKGGDDIQISDDKMTITKKTSTQKNWNNTSYGKTWIDSSIPQIVEWKFKIHTMRQANMSIFISLVSCDNRLNEDCNEQVNKCDYPNYGFSAYRSITIRQKTGDIANRIVYRKNGIYLHEGDVLSMILDTKEKAIYAETEGKCKVNLISNITINKDTKYKMAVSIRRPTYSLSLIDFKCDLL